MSVIGGTQAFDLDDLSFGDLLRVETGFRPNIMFQRGLSDSVVYFKDLIRYGHT